MSEEEFGYQDGEYEEGTVENDEYVFEFGEKTMNKISNSIL
mgnify:CR=1 FL=1